MLGKTPTELKISIPDARQYVKIIKRVMSKESLDKVKAQKKISVFDILNHENINLLEPFKRKKGKRKRDTHSSAGTRSDTTEKNNQKIYKKL